MVDKKQDISNAALNLFYQKGIHAVGINEVISASSVAKKTMYHHFPSKEALIVETIMQRDNNFMCWFSSLLAQSDTPQESIINIFNGLDDWFNNRASLLGDFRGCFFINVSAEYSNETSPIYRACQFHKEKIAKLIREKINEFCSNETRAKELTLAITLLKEGCITNALVRNERSCAKDSIPIIRALLQIYGDKTSQ